MRALKALSPCFSSATKFIFVSNFFAVYSPNLDIIKEDRRRWRNHPMQSQSSALIPFKNLCTAMGQICSSAVCPFLFTLGENNFFKGN